MTIGKILDLRRRRRSYFIAGSYTGFVVTFSLFVVERIRLWPAFVVLLAFIGTVASANFLPCLRCKGGIASVRGSFGKATLLQRSINFCSYCGVSLDEESCGKLANIN